MAKFKVGDKARVVRTGPKMSKYLGCEVEILDIDNSSVPYKISLIDEETGRNIWGHDDNLEPILKRPELGSIEELSNTLGGWMPSKNVEVV